MEVPLAWRPHGVLISGDNLLSILAPSKGISITTHYFSPDFALDMTVMADGDSVLSKVSKKSILFFLLCTCSILEILMDGGRKE